MAFTVYTVHSRLEDYPSKRWNHTPCSLQVEVGTIRWSLPSGPHSKSSNTSSQFARSCQNNLKATLFNAHGQYM